MKRHLPFIIATVLCFPFCAFLVAYALARALKLVVADIPDLIAMPLRTGFHWLSQWPGVVLFVLLPVSASVVAAWFQTTKTKAEMVATRVYSIVMALYLAVALSCLLTRQVFDL